MREYRYTTPHGIQVTRSASKTNFRKGLQHLLKDLDHHRGFYLSSGYEYPGRYSRWDFASTCPPLEIIAYDRLFQFEPIEKKLPRAGHKDLHLFLCDDIWYMDRKKEVVERFQYEFEREGASTRGLARDGDEVAPPTPKERGPIISDHTPEE